MRSSHAHAGYVCLCAAVLLAGLCGCGSEGEESLRYELEKRVYDAHVLERMAYAEYPVDTYGAWRSAEQAYLDILPVLAISAPAGDTVIATEIERLVVAAKIGLLRLYALDLQLHAGITHLPGDDRGSGAGKPESWCQQLPRAGQLYAGLTDEDRVGRCVALMTDVAETPALWLDTALLRDSLLAVPHQLVAPVCDTSGVAARAALAEEFYTRIVATWPDSLVALGARRHRARVRARVARYELAIEDLDALARLDADHSLDLELERAELLAFGLRRHAEGARALRDIADIHRDDPASWSARLYLALLEARQPSRGSEGIRSLHQIQLERGVPGEVARRAAFWRARSLEDTGNWEEAASEYWQLCALYPFTREALSAPLRVIRHHAGDAGGPQAARAFDRAVAFYEEVIDRDSAVMRPRYIAMDFLVEACLEMGAPERAVELLDRGAERWGGDRAVIARLKSALICLEILDDPEKADDNLKKSLARFSGSRYLTTTYRVSDIVRSARDSDNVIDVPHRPR